MEVKFLLNWKFEKDIMACDSYNAQSIKHPSRRYFAFESAAWKNTFYCGINNKIEYSCSTLKQARIKIQRMEDES